MKLALLVNYDSAAALALRLLAPALEQHELRVFYTDKQSRSEGELAQLAAFDRAQVSTVSIFNELRTELTNDVNGADFDRWQDYSADLAISIRHMSILKSKAISVPAHGVINLHSGVLPHYQGVMATYWAMHHREPELGTTLHRIEDASIDTGAVIARSTTATRYDKSYFWNVLNLYRDGCRNIIAAVQKIETGKSFSAEPQSGQGAYFTFPTASELAGFAYPLYSSSDSLLDFWE